MCSKFTWLPKFTATIERLPEDARGRFVRALIEYGTYGRAPEFDNWALAAVFEALREDIDNNKSYRDAASRGGRAKNAKQPREEQSPYKPEETGEKPLKGGLKGGFKGGLKSCEGGFLSKPNHTIPNQTIPKNKKSVGQVKTGEAGNEKPREDREARAVSLIVSYLNEKTGKHFKATSSATRRHICARLREGYKVEDFRRVIDSKAGEWLNKRASDGREMTQYLCPETLFGSKFEKYLNALGDSEGDEYANL